LADLVSSSGSSFGDPIYNFQRKGIKEVWRGYHNYTNLERWLVGLRGIQFYKFFQRFSEASLSREAKKHENQHPPISNDKIWEMKRLTADLLSAREIEKGVEVLTGVHSG